jgi:hypothetical protein
MHRFRRCLPSAARFRKQVRKALHGFVLGSAGMSGSSPKHLLYMAAFCGWDGLHRPRCRPACENAKKVTISLIYWQPKPTTHGVRSVVFVLPVGKSTYPIFCCCWAARDPLLQVPAFVHHNGAPSRLAGRASAAAIPAVRPRAVRRPRLCRGRPPAATRADERGTFPASLGRDVGVMGASLPEG